MQKIVLWLILLLIVSSFAIPISYSQASTSTPINVSEPIVKRLDGTKLMQIKDHSQVILSVTIKNNEDVHLAYVAIVEVRDQDAITTYLQYQKGDLNSKSSTEIEISWIAERAGEYRVRTFLLSELSNPTILSPVMQSSITVGSAEIESVEIGDDNQSKDTSNDKNIEDNQQDPTYSNSELMQLREHALLKINEDREKYNLSSVELSDNEAAQVHAEDVFKTKEISHWMTNGEKPYMTYSRYDGTGDVAQNVVVSGGKEFYDSCISGKYLCHRVDPSEEVDKGEYVMMYEDEECCENGHRDNILDKYHTHVSIGIAYDDYFFVMVQNFENQYITWNNRIDRDNPNDTTVTMAGYFDRNTDGYSNNNVKLDGIAIYYDPLPTHATYTQNYDKKSYDAGEFIASVVEPVSSGWYYEQPDDYTLIEAKQWNVYNKDFKIEFSFDQVQQQYDDGVYTVTIWCKDENDDDFVASSVSLFIEK